MLEKYFIKCNAFTKINTLFTLISLKNLKNKKYYF